MSSSRLLAVLFIFLMLALCVTQAQARIFVIGDQDDGYTISFPDTWDMITNQKPDDKLTIAAPGEGDYATCRVRVREDRRYMTYPSSYSRSIQQASYSSDFWSTYLNEYDAPSLSRVVDGLELGRIPASRADAYYMTSVGSRVQKQAVMMGGLYNGRAYIVECSAAAGAFQHWEGTFHTVMDSFAPIRTGNGKIQSYYRNFQNDPLLIINRQAHDDRTLYY